MAGDKSATCRFGADRLKPRLRAFVREIDGVRAGTDPECVHRMRVASRRLRSALPLFSSCFAGRKFRRWVREIRAITRALGNARDTDVQLAFLDLYERDLHPVSGAVAGISWIRAILQERRRQEQETILSALAVLDDRKILQEISVTVQKTGRAGRRKGAVREYGQEVSSMAAHRIAEVLSALLSYDAIVHDPGNVEGHHAMRIAAKKLRYTLEVFRPLYPDRLRPAIRSIKELQELLGQLHDCDVWIALLADIVAGNYSPAGDTARAEGVAPVSPEEEAGIAALLLNRRAHRNELYGRLVTEWESGAPASLGDRLRAAVPGSPATEPGIVPVPGAPVHPRPADERIGALAGLYPQGAGHCRQVTRLALMLFDQLASLHGYGKKDRLLLEYAGLLHDIGWAHGQKGHHTRSCRLILSDRTLPVTVRERKIIALLARYHRKALPGEPDRVFSALRQKDRRRVLALSALLRIADGLDYTHGNRVASVSCTVTPGAVTCVPAYDGDGAIERARALQKSDLFGQVFEKRFEIP